MRLFNFQATTIGSLWHKDPQEAVSSILDIITDIPCWPQLPQRNFKENMYVQFSEGIPGLVIEEEERRIFVDTARVKDEEMAYVYEHYINEDLNAYSLGKDYAAGFYEFLSRLKENPAGYSYIKGEITGPVSFLLTVPDENKKPLIYQSQFADCISKIIAMKVRWQIRKLKKISPNVIIFIDEPYLVSLGSGYVNLNRHELEVLINEVIDAVHKESAVAGIHCCGNTDWEFLTQTKTDIISFDAYEFSESLSLYPEAIREFLERDGTIAWGIVPTNQDINKMNTDDLIIRLNSAIELLRDKGIDKELICQHSLVSPSCGLGNLSSEQGEKILKCAQQLSKLKDKYGLAEKNPRRP